MTRLQRLKKLEQQQTKQRVSWQAGQVEAGENEAFRAWFWGSLSAAPDRSTIEAVFKEAVMKRAELTQVQSLRRGGVQ